MEYKNYPHLHPEDAREKIAQIKQVVPDYYRANSLLDVGCGSAEITMAIAERHRIQLVHALEMSDIGFATANHTLKAGRHFKETNVEQIDFSQMEPHLLYDLIMFIDVLEHTEDPVTMLQKAARMAIFAIIRCPLENSLLNLMHKKLYGEDMQEIMAARYGHIHHFAPNSLRQLIEHSGFDVITSANFRVPHNAQILEKLLNKLSEQMCHLMAKGLYPNLIGGFYTAFCKSRAYQIIDYQSEKIILETIKDYFGADNLVSACIFGSMARNTSKEHSDYDFTIILKKLPANINDREKASPALKLLLKALGVSELCAFNLYTAEELINANAKNSWLIETMKNGNRIIYDKNNFIGNIINNKKEEVVQIEKFSWTGIKSESPSRFMETSSRHDAVADLLEKLEPDIAAYHRDEALRGVMMAEAYKNGIYNSRGSIYSLGKMLHQKGIDINHDLIGIQQKNFNFEMRSKPSIYDYRHVQHNLNASEYLETNGYALDALFHAYMALKNIYLKLLHNNDIYIVDGEVTQLFIREFGSRLPKKLLQQMVNNSFKAEQILGRCGYASFDLNAKGESIYEDGANTYDYSSLISMIKQIINDLGAISDGLIDNTGGTPPTVSIVLATYNRKEHIQRCLEFLNRLIFPESKLEIVIVDDGSDQNYDSATLTECSKFPLRYVKKEHSGICATKNRGIEESTGKYIAFLDDDIVASPLWLVQLLSGFKNEHVSGVGSTVLTYPNDNPLSMYIDYRELIRRPFRDKTEEILNIITCSACIKRKVLEEIDGFNKKQSVAGVDFGGDDVDITWKIRNLGYQLNHVEDALVFHNHRNNLKGLILQHIGYGEGTMFHCIEKNRNPAELGIPKPNYLSVMSDSLRYLIYEIPKRVVECHKNRLGIKNTIIYPLLDFCRRMSYNIGILKARKFLKINN